MPPLVSQGLLIIAKPVLGTFEYTSKNNTKDYNYLIGIACIKNRIVFIGDVNDAKRFLKNKYKTIDMSNHFVLPGFIDSHTHCFASIKAMNSVNLSFSKASNTKEKVMNILYDAIKAKKNDECLIAVGFDETLMKSNWYPSRDELDKLSSNHSIQIIHRTGHASFLNSKALKICEINESTHEPEGAYFSRDIYSGMLDGYIIGFNAIIDKKMEKFKEKFSKNDMMKWLKIQVSQGITTITHANPDSNIYDWQFFIELLEANAFIPNIILMESIHLLNEKRFPRNGLNGRVLRGHTKLILNEFESLVEEDRNELKSIIAMCEKQERKLAVHVISNNTIDYIIGLIKETKTTIIKRIEHAPMLNDDQMNNLISKKISIVAQPGILYEAQNRYKKLITEKDMRYLHPWKSFIDQGGVLAFSSDSPVTSQSPLLSISYASIQRPKELNFFEKVEPLQAIQAWTATGAKVNNLSNRGFLKSGYMADIILVDRNPIHEPEKTSVVMTLISGNIAYSK
ncbi:MAG: amidohydrolase family protein [Dehalococcoidia bacterium]|nr:amidohydrolase family protein [Dehalococcoidia bacterium]